MHISSLSVAQAEGKAQQQIPGGNDRKKSKGNNKSNSRFPEGMTGRKTAN